MAKFTIEEPSQKFTVEEPSPKFIIEEPGQGIPAPLQRIKDRPFRSIITPLSTTLTGESLHERAVKATEPTFIEPNNPVSYWTAFAKSALGGMVGEAADIATTPLSLVGGPAAKGVTKTIGKIPIKGTTLGEIATKVPISQIFKEDVAAIVSYQNALKNIAERTAASRSPFVILRNLNNPVGKITRAIKEAGPVRELQNNLFRVERAKRAAVLKGISSKTTGEQSFFQKLSSLKGELPKADFSGIRNQVTQADVDELFNMINRNTLLDEFQKVTAGNGLRRLLGDIGSSVPRESELKLLNKVFPADFMKSVLEKRPLMKQNGQLFSDLYNLPRSIMSTFDMSAPLRQGIFLIGRPRQWVPSFKNMFRYFANEQSYDDLIRSIQHRPNFPLMRKAGLAITDLGKKLSNREEAFMSTLAERIPLLGRGVRASNRAYTGFLDKLRADVFDDFVRVAEQQKIPLTDKLLKDMGSFLNAATGRGNLPKALEGASTTLNGLFFSPRLISSRLTLMNPHYYTKLDPFVRKEALRSLMSFSGVGSSILTLAHFAGAEVGMDPRSADFAKIKTGNTRFDILGGFQQYMRLAAQIYTGEHISSTTGVKTTVGKGFKPLTRKEILDRFVQSKEAPLLRFGLSALSGQGFAGRPFDVSEETVKLFIPMVLQDMADLTKEHGPTGAAIAAPAFFGVGVQTYSPTATEIVFSGRSAVKHAKDLLKQGDIEGSQRLLDRNKDLIDLAGKLRNGQKSLSLWQRRLNDLMNQKDITDEERLRRRREIDFNIQDIEERMEQIVEQERSTQ